VGATFLYPVLEPLVVCDVNERVICEPPSLAESFDVSADGKTITFHLRKGIKFHDGTPFNADAVKYNLEQDLAKNIGGSAVLKNIASYDVVDDNTLRLNLKQFDATLLLRMAQGIIGLIASPTAMKKPAAPETVAKEHFVGTGPFKFDSWQRDAYVKFVKNPDYWQKGKPYVDAIHYRNIADQTVSVMGLKAGETNAVMDIMDVAVGLNLKGQGYYLGVSPLTFIFNFLTDSANKDSPFADVRLRQAVEYAVDKTKIAQIWYGPATNTYAAYQFAGKNDPWYVPGLTERTYNPVKAKQLLTDAGYPGGLKYGFISDTRAPRDAMTATMTYLQDVGINVTLDMADVSRYTAFTKDGWKGILYPGFPVWSSFTSIVSRFNDPLTTYPGQLKPAGFKDKWDAVVAQPDFDKRMTQMKELITIVNEQALVYPLVVNSAIWVTDNTVMDMNWHGRHTNQWWDPGNVWLKKKK
jgi:ABC-type transport system substrate-binding protein